MWVGKEDNLSTPQDARWARDQLGDSVVKYVEMDNVAHSTFNFGKDMSYVHDMIDLVETHM